MRKRLVSKVAAVSMATALLFGGATNENQTEAATVKKPLSTSEQIGRAKQGVCEIYFACESLNTYVTYASGKHTLQHLDYYDAYEPNKRSTLKPGRYYLLTYSNDTPIKAVEYDVTPKQKKALDAKVKRIKAQQATAKKRGKLHMYYTYGVKF
ncbi:hypothetical protein [Macrococcus capreoli]|uniref:hypothetical protein n=1 Tax=Macrococcus capreoli TaxID=2982690 RepID=UPI0021D6089D|nr:hypothetical protein [Macrococcus sp. TMW 2.2395]MCU7556551.1 hypothetical protein [Macrococcus sp. TMW 2.2395]